MFIVLEKKSATCEISYKVNILGEGGIQPAALGNQIIVLLIREGRHVV